MRQPFAAGLALVQGLSLPLQVSLLLQVSVEHFILGWL